MLRALGASACVAARGEVEVRPDDPDHADRRLAANRETPREHVDVVSLLVTEPEFAFVGRRAAQRRHRAPAVARGMSSGCSRRSQALMCGSISCSRVSEHLVSSAVSTRPRRSRGSSPRRPPVPREGQRQPLLAFAQKGLRAPALADVTNGELQFLLIDIEQDGRDLNVIRTSGEGRDLRFD